jgi:glycosyltransferase involved in cell wall biosynthesis
MLPNSIARVVTIHDLVWKYEPHTMRPLSLLIEKILMPEAIRSADLILADSQSTGAGIAEVFPEFFHKVRVVHLGAIAPPLVSENAIAVDIFKPYFLFVGTLEPRKNLERLLNAFALVPQFFRDKFSLVIAGGAGWGGVNLEKLVAKNGLQDSVKLLGYVSDQQLAWLYSHAQFLAMPSLYEGFGLPLVEAMQFSLPILTSNIGSMAEIVGNAALLVDPLSTESISHGIIRLLSDQDLISMLRLNSIHRSKEFSWSKCADETITVFEEAMAIRDSRIARN